MNEIPISPNIWNLAAAILTERQLLVLQLRERHGFSQNQCAINLNCTRSNVRELHASAKRNLLNAIEEAGSIEMALARALGPPTDPPPKPEDSLRAVLSAQPRPTSESTIRVKFGDEGDIA